MGEAASGCGRGGRPDWRGHKTFYDKDRGFWHEPLTAEECQALSEAIERSLKERAAREKVRREELARKFRDERDG
jgi:hypothetical protein